MRNIGLLLTIFIQYPLLTYSAGAAVQVYDTGSPQFFSWVMEYWPMKDTHLPESHQESQLTITEFNLNYVPHDLVFNIRWESELGFFWMFDREV